MLNDQQKEFILKNHKTQSARQIARQLNVSRLDIEQFIKGIPKERISLDFLSKYKKALNPHVFVMRI